jgi:hypothetical protein
MDSATALTRVYLHLNGYFTVTEYPVLELMARGGYRAATDIDILAYRLPQSGGLLPARDRRARVADVQDFVPDPELGEFGSHPDLLIAEVKEGAAELNRGARTPAVLTAVLTRFACAPSSEQPHVVEALLRKGEATVSSGLRIRLLAFGSSIPVVASPGAYRRISLGHVIDFLQRHLREHWDLISQAQIHDPGFGFLATMEKARRGTSR